MEDESHLKIADQLLGLFFPTLTLNAYVECQLPSKLEGKAISHLSHYYYPAKASDIHSYEDSDPFDFLFLRH
jgi:hypothetical protein